MDLREAKHSQLSIVVLGYSDGQGKSEASQDPRDSQGRRESHGTGRSGINDHD